MTVQTEPIPSFEYLEKILTNVSGNVPLHERFRALFTLKNIGDNTSIDIIAKGFSDDSALLKHELAYVLGQTKNKHALPVLFQVLENTREDAMVRHEAAEALGAIGDTTSLPILSKYLHDDQEVVRQTCELAINRINFQESQQEFPISIYQSVDPAPAALDIDSIEELKQILLNPNLPLFERYRAMFALRNKGGEESVLALAEGFNDKSALFRHEIAYVFGQMQHPASVPSLLKTLKNPLEQPMVRHEAAEALGSIATPDVLPVLEQYRKDNERVVSESCIVALDMYEYENSNQFQPLDGVTS